MKMDKPTVEAVRFNSADVIATSGGVADTFTVDYFNNGKQGDLTVTYMGNPYTDWKQLRDALKAGGHDPADASNKKTDTYTRQGDQGENTIDGWYSYDEVDGFGWLYSDLNQNVNGIYTWYDAGKYWRHN